MTRQLLTVAITVPPTLEAGTAVAVAKMAGRLGFSAIHLSPEADMALLDRLVDVAAPTMVVIDLPEQTSGIVRTNDPVLVARTRAELDASGEGRPLLVAVPISIGRTMNEAAARADMEPRFSGPRHPREVGVFGTFADAQEQVLDLARAGADGLLLDVPFPTDVADVLAQIRALVVGATPELLGRASVRAVPPPRTVFYGE